MKLEEKINRLLSERLEQFNVPVEIRNNICTEIMAILAQPQAGPKGTYVYKPEQSVAADLERKQRPKL